MTNSSVIENTTTLLQEKNFYIHKPHHPVLNIPLLFVYCRGCGILFADEIPHRNVSCPSCNKFITDDNYIRTFVTAPTWTHKVVTKFPDAVVYTLLGTTVSYANKTGEFYSKRHTLRLRIKNTGRMQVISNRRLVNDVTELMGTLDTINKHFNFDINLDKFYQANNPRLGDIIPYIGTQEGFGNKIQDFYSFLNSSARSRIYKAYDKGGIKLARHALIGLRHKNKRLTTFAWSNLQMTNYIRLGLKLGATADQLALLIDDPLKNNVMKKTILLMGLNYSFMKARNTACKLNLYDVRLEDTYRMYREIKTINPDYNLPQVRLEELHDIVMRDYNEYKMLQQEKIILPVPKIRNTTIEDIDIVHPQTSYDLSVCGNKMNICVGSYSDLVLTKKTQIFFMKKEEEFLACIQVIDNTVVQAKLKNNLVIANNLKYLSVLNEWIEINSLDVCTNDVSRSRYYAPEYEEYEVDDFLPF